MEVVIKIADGIAADWDYGFSKNSRINKNYFSLFYKHLQKYCIM